MRSTAGRVARDLRGGGYFGTLDTEEEVAHPAPGGDLCTSLTIDLDVLAEITGGDTAMPVQPIAIDSAAYR